MALIDLMQREPLGWHTEGNVAAIPQNGLVALWDVGLPGAFTPPSSKNLITYSEQFDKWTTGALNGPAAPTLSYNTQVSPIGTLSADTLNVPAVSGTNAFSVLSQGFTATAQQYTFSLWLRAESAQNIYIALCATGGATAYATLCNVTTSWQRFTVTGVASASTWYVEVGVDLRGGGTVAQSASTVYIWGAQLETGNTATSYEGTGGYVPRGNGGQYLLNTVPNPADGMPSAAYDLQLNSLPSGTGYSRGKWITNHLVTNGQSGCRLSMAANTPFTNGLHKTGSNFTIFAVAYIPTTISNWVPLFINMDVWSNNIGGIHFGVGTNGAVYVNGAQQGGVNLFSVSGTTNRKNTMCFIACSVSNGGTSFIYGNGDYDGVPTAVNWTNTTDPQGGVPRAFNSANLGGGTADANTRLYTMGMYNRSLSKYQLDTIFEAVRGRYGI